MELQQIDNDEDDGPPPGWEPIAPPQPTPPPSLPTPTLPLPTPPPSLPTPPPQLPNPPPPPPPLSPDMAQMVCGSCRRLLKYLKGARYVQCSCCSTVNYVLEAQEVGQVKCGSCAVLLMYQYGASSVRCSSCTSVTEIGVHNRRPPWSVQQGQATPPTNVQ